jgi:hypothetical protein
MRAPWRRPIYLWLGVMLALGACSPSAKKTAPPKRCTEFGQQCEFAPGKLGACVVRDGCTGDDCLLCQSQH